jgi:hypothetical protein
VPGYDPLNDQFSLETISMEARSDAAEAKLGACLRQLPTPGGERSWADLEKVLIRYNTVACATDYNHYLTVWREGNKCSAMDNGARSASAATAAIAAPAPAPAPARAWRRSPRPSASSTCL